MKVFSAVLTGILASAMVITTQSAKAAASVTLPWYDDIPSTYADGSLGASGSGSTAWILGSASADMAVKTGAGLSYSGLTAPPAGSKGVACVASGTARNRGVSFANQNTAGTTVYCSFLLKVTSAPTANNIIAALHSSTSSFGSTPTMTIILNSSHALGIGIQSSTPLATTPLNLGETYFVVASYSLVSGTANDTVALWLNPTSFGGAAPSPTLGPFTTGSAGKTDVGGILGFWINLPNQGMNLTNDEFRVGLNWADVAPSGCTTPTAYNVTGGGAYCSGGSGVSVGLANSDTGIDYRLLRSGAQVGATQPGNTSSALDFGLQTVAGTYSVSGSNTTTACVGGMNGTATVTVNTPPVITAAPTNSVVCEGTTATFAVTATGSGLTYQWQTNNGAGWADVTGATTASYTTAPTAASDNNLQFQCIVSGTCTPSPVTSSPPAVLTVGSGVSISSGPSSATVSVSSTPTFSVSASGPGLTYQWQFSTDAGASFNNVTTGTGANGPAYTTAALATGDSGTEFQCVVSASCGTPGTSTVATVTVNAANYRSKATGNWTALGTWEQSYDQGGTWVAATTYPTAANTTNILVRNGHTVTMTTLVAVDDATFENGSTFVWGANTAAAIPTANWQNGSTCVVTNGPGSTHTPTGLSQDFYNFTWNWPSQANSATFAGGLTNVRGNFIVTAGATVTLAGTTANTLNILGNFTNNAGNGKVLIQAGSSAGITINVAGNFVNAGTVDANSGGTPPVINFNGGSTQVFTPGSRTNPGRFNYDILASSTVALSANLSSFSTFTNNGTLNMGTNQFTSTGTLGLNAGSTLMGNGTNQLSTGLTEVDYGGTLNLPGLPAFVGGESFLLFGATLRSGGFGAFVPAIPGTGLTWDTSLLNSGGILAVSSGSATAPAPTITNAVITVDGLVLKGTNGAGNHLYYVVVSTDPTASRATWTTNATSAFDAAGNFSITNSIGPSKQFYMIKYPTP